MSNKYVFALFENEDELIKLFSTEKKAKAYIKKWKHRSLHYEIMYIY